MTMRDADLGILPASAIRQLVGRPGLSDSRLAGEENEPSMPALGRAELGVKHLHLCFATDEDALGRQDDAVHSPGRATHTVPPDEGNARGVRASNTRVRDSLLSGPTGS